MSCDWAFLPIDTVKCAVAGQQGGKVRLDQRLRGLRGGALGHSKRTGELGAGEGAQTR